MIDVPDQQLSAHEHQRLAIARVLLHEPDWVLLDEATSMLDEAMEKRVYGGGHPRRFVRRCGLATLTAFVTTLVVPLILWLPPRALERLRF